MKSYTDIEQSKKLAEILPSVSADMIYTPFGDTHPWVWDRKLKEKDSTLCWSLAALLEVLEDTIHDDYGNEYTLNIYKEGTQYSLSYIHEYNLSKDIKLGMYDDFVDCCYDMIIKLHELNLI